MIFLIENVDISYHVLSHILQSSKYFLSQEKKNDFFENFAVVLPLKFVCCIIWEKNFLIQFTIINISQGIYKIDLTSIFLRGIARANKKHLFIRK